MSITDLINEQRRALASREEAAALELGHAYAVLADELEPALRGLSAAIEARGDKASITWLRQQEQYKRLLAGARAAYLEYGRQAARTVEQHYAEALNYGLRDARMLLAVTAQIAAPDPTKQERAAILAGQRRRLAKLALPRSISSLAVTGLATVLRAAVKNLADLPKLVERAREKLGGILINVLRAARSESTTAYRAVVLGRFVASGVSGWQWAAELDKSPAPCAVCVAMHGQVFSGEEPFGSHPGCRCLAIPVIEGVGPAIDLSGDTWLRQQDEAKQVAVLGRGKRRHFVEGRLQLADLVIVADHPIYGVSRHERSLKALGLSPGGVEA